MKELFARVIVPLVVCFAFVGVQAQSETAASKPAKRSVSKYEPAAIKNSTELQSLVDKAANETLRKYAPKGLKAEDLAVTLIDLRDPADLKMGQFHGEQKIYPASVVKMFYLVALHRWLEDGRVKDTPELRRAMKDMIVDSYNDATQFVVDVLTGTANGEELSPDKLKKYADKREVVNRYFAGLGFQNINVNQKTYCEDLYGRERQFWNSGKNRNMLTTDATARLLAEIVLGKAVNAEHSRQMMDLMKRDFAGQSKDPDDQAHGFTAIALNNLNLSGAKLWSKAGWTSATRHDAAYVETPAGLKFVLVTFTQNQANERDIIPGIAQIILENLGAIK